MKSMLIIQYWQGSSKIVSAIMYMRCNTSIQRYYINVLQHINTVIMFQ